MADSDVIGGIENLTDAVSGEIPSYEYKDPNTDMMKAISKCIDAATGETGTEYEYKNPNTDVIKKMDELAVAISEGGGAGGNYSDDLFDGTLISNTYIDKTNGSLVPYNGWSSTDFIDVSKINDFYICGAVAFSSDRDYNAWYDGDKNFISSLWLSSHITVPSTAKYVRISGKTDAITGTKMFYSVE